jgi:hypothetical protein
VRARACSAIRCRPRRLAEAREDVAGDPHLVGGVLGALAEDLELPLTLCDLGIDALEVDPRREAGVDVLLHELAGDRPDVLEAHARVVRALRRRESALGEAEGRAVLPEKVLLLESEPGVRVVRDRRAGIRGMRRLAIRHHDLIHHQHAVLARDVGIDGHGLEDAVGVFAFGLLRRAPVKPPHGELLELRKAGKFLDLSLAAQARQRSVPVEPDIFEFVFGHS